MIKLGSFTKWLSELFGAARAGEIEYSGRFMDGDAAELELEKVAIQSAVGMISAAVGQCRFRTFLDGKEKRDEEYYLWNYSPNGNQKDRKSVV